MLQAYSENLTLIAGSAIPFNNVTIEKGCTATMDSPSTIRLNRCGVYMVSFDASAAAGVTLELSKDGVLQPQAQSTGTSPHFTTLVQVDRNNTGCACTSPVRLQLISEDAGTLTNANIVVTKIV